jgi:putative addiction module CopG family antidote
MSEPVPLDQFVAQQLASGRYQSYDALVEEALRLLQEREAEADRTPTNGETAGSTEEEMAVSQRSASVLDIFREAREAIPDETWDTLPPDLAAQHDHYIYGTPKRPA